MTNRSEQEESKRKVLPTPPACEAESSAPPREPPPTDSRRHPHHRLGTPFPWSKILVTGLIGIALAYLTFVYGVRQDDSAVRQSRELVNAPPADSKETAAGKVPETQPDLPAEPSEDKQQDTAVLKVASDDKDSGDSGTEADDAETSASPVDSANVAVTPDVETFPSTPHKVAVPSRDAITAAEQTTREVFAEEHAAAISPSDRAAFARRLLFVALETTDDVASRFVTLRAARNAAIQAGNVELTYQTVTEISKSFEIDFLDEQAQVAQELAKASLVDEERSKLKAHVARLRRDAFAADLIPLAMTLNETAGRISRDAKWAEEAEKWKSLLEAAAAATGELNAAIEVLEDSPNDAAANLTVGRYRCFLKGDWEKGLPHLTRSDDSRLLELSNLELADDPSAEDMLGLADAWVDYSSVVSAVEASQVQRRAASYYQALLPDLRGITKLRVEKQLDEFRAAGIDVDAITPIKEVADTATTLDGDTLASSVNSAADLKSFLNDTVWQRDREMTLKRDGWTVHELWTKNGLATRWEAIDRRTVLLVVERGRKVNRYCVLVFSEDLTSYQEFDFTAGERSLRSRRRIR